MASRSSESISFEQRDEENQRLREENARLRRLLAVHGIPVPQFVPDDARPLQTIAPATVESKEERARKRIVLFRNLFRGREDVYARRWENPDGRSGYSPAALKDWKAINSSRAEDRKKVERLFYRSHTRSDTVYATPAHDSPATCRLIGTFRQSINLAIGRMLPNLSSG